MKYCEYVPENSTYTGDLFTLSNLFKSRDTFKYCFETNQK